MNRGTLERYVLRELIVPFLAATAVLLSLFYAMVLVRGVEFLLGSAATPGDWATLGSAMLPMLLPQVLPLAFLIGVMIGFARLGEDNELTAFAALGVSPTRLATPVLGLALVVSAVLAGTVFFWKPWGIATMRQTARAVIERNILGDLKPGSLRVDLPGVVFYAEDVKPGPTWGQVVMIDERDPARLQVLTAPRARASFDTGVGLRLDDGLLVQRAGPNEVTTTSFSRGDLLFNVADALNRRDTFRFGHEELSPQDLLERAEAASKSGATPAPFLSAFHLRLSQLLAPLALGLVAAAVAQSGRRRAARSAALLAFGLYLAFYVFTRAFVQLGEKEVVSPWAAGHVPVLVAALVGVVWLTVIERRGAR